MKNYYFFSATSLLLIMQILVSSGQNSPTVCLQEGVCYEGAWINYIDGNSNKRFASYQGIRYAQPPLNNLRFVSPQPYIAEEGVYNVSVESTVICSQVGEEGFTGQEDCLFLNVYVPEIEYSRPLSVMVWIYGGGFIEGSNTYHDYGPKHFMDKEVIVVTINYRLGPLGFLYEGTELIPGNVGLRDQVMALEWVNANIEYFGGNPDSVTIFGESAGSLSVALHLLSPLSNGLFQRAIIQSGEALNPAWAPISQKNALKYAHLLAKELNCDLEDTEIKLKCMQEKNVDDILALTDLMEGGQIWMPVPDYIPSSNSSYEPFLPQSPEQLLSSGNFNTNVDVMIGNTADEGIVYLLSPLAGYETWEDFKNNFDVYGPRNLFNIANKSEISETDIEKTNQIVEFYLGSNVNINEEHQQELFDMFTDASMQYGNYRTIQYLLKNNVKTFNYIFSYEGQFSASQAFAGVDPVGVCHGDDLIYLWEPLIEDSGLGPLTGTDVNVRELMTEFWKNFAVFGNPTPSGSKYSWLPVTNSRYQQFLNISGLDPQMTISEDIQRKMDFWESLLN